MIAGVAQSEFDVAWYFDARQGVQVGNTVDRCVIPDQPSALPVGNLVRSTMDRKLWNDLNRLMARRGTLSMKTINAAATRAS